MLNSFSKWAFFFLQIVALAMLFGFFCYLVFYMQVYEWASVWEYRQLFLTGWLITLYLSLISLMLSVAFGTLAALCKLSSYPFLRYGAIGYIEFIRGTPLLVQILVFYYVIAYALALENRYVAGILTLSLFSGAYIAEMIRAGIESISQTQLESARAICLTKWQTYRFIIFPQAFRLTLPPLAGQFASIIKDSSLLSIIGINEFTNSAQQVNSATYSTLESFIPLAAGYLLLTLPISLLGKKLEKRFRYET